MPSARFRLYRDAIIGRVNRLFGQSNDPYPTRPSEARLSPHLGLRAAMAAAIPSHAFTSRPAGQSAPEWQGNARQHLRILMGMEEPEAAPHIIAEGPTIELPDGLSRRTIYLRVRPETDVPVTLIEPAEKRTGRPVFIHLAGSTSGVHLGWGEAKVPIDHLRLEAGAAMALEAAKRGYLAVCIEQLGFGERAERDLSPTSSDPIADASNHALLLGRSLMGDKAMDLIAVVNWLTTQAESLKLDAEKLYLFGHSAGGSMAFYGAALEPRIAGVLCSGSIGRIRDTVGARRISNGDAVVPGILKSFEAEDIVAMIAPRPFIGLSGKRDHIFPYDGVADVARRAMPAYEAFDASDKIHAIACEGGHRYYGAESWKAWEDVIAPDHA